MIRFSWGSIDFNAVVQSGKITDGRIFSDCLNPDFIEKMNLILKSKAIEYSVEGIKKFGNLLRNDVGNDSVLIGYVDEVEDWLVKSI